MFTESTSSYIQLYNLCYSEWNKNVPNLIFRLCTYIVHHQRAHMHNMSYTFSSNANSNQGLCSKKGRKRGRDRSYIPSYYPLFCLRASINFTTICLSIGRKVRAAPTSTKETSKRSENIVTFHFEQIFKKKTNKQTENLWSVMDVWNRQSENQ